MTEERKTEIVEAILAAYRETGLRPGEGCYYDTVARCACAVGVAVVHRRGDVVRDLLPARISAAFRDDFGVSGCFESGVTSGFDGYHLAIACPDTGDGYDVGRRVRIAVGLETP